MLEVLLAGGTPYVNYIVKRLQQFGLVTLGAGVTESTNSASGKGSLVFSGASNSKITVTNPSGGLPSGFVVGTTTDLLIDTWLYLDNTSQAILCGNLNNNAGTGSWWVTLNNTYQVFASVSIDGYSTTGEVQRFRFGTATLPVNTWFRLTITKSGNSLYVKKDNVFLGSVQTISKGFGGNTANPFCIAGTTDNALMMRGKIDDLTIITNVVPTATSISTDSIGIAIVGGTKQLTYSVTPTGAPITDKVYASSNTAIMTIDANGLMSFVSEGGFDASLTAKNNVGTTLSDSSGGYASTLSVYTDSLSAMNVGTTQQLIATITPDGAASLSDMVITYTTTDATVATVDSNGLITAIADGGCRIGCTATYQGIVTASDSSYLSVNAV